jgi:hypothetical protein
MAAVGTLDLEPILGEDLGELVAGRPGASGGARGVDQPDGRIEQAVSVPVRGEAIDEVA